MLRVANGSGQWAKREGVGLILSQLGSDPLHLHCEVHLVARQSSLPSQPLKLTNHMSNLHNAMVLYSHKICLNSRLYKEPDVWGPITREAFVLGVVMSRLPSQSFLHSVPTLAPALNLMWRLLVLEHRLFMIFAKSSTINQRVPPSLMGSLLFAPSFNDMVQA